MLQQLRHPPTQTAVPKTRKVVLVIDMGGSTELGFVDAETLQPIRVSDNPESPYYFAAFDTPSDSQQLKGLVVPRVQEMLAHADTAGLIVLGIGISSRPLPHSLQADGTVKELPYGVYSADEAGLGPVARKGAGSGWKYCDLPKAVQDAANGLPTFVAKDIPATALLERLSKRSNPETAAKDSGAVLIWIQGTGVGATSLTPELQPAGRLFSEVDNPVGGAPIQMPFITIEHPLRAGENLPLHSIGDMLFEYYHAQRTKYLEQRIPKEEAEKSARADTAELNFRSIAPHVKTLAQKAGAQELRVFGNGARLLMGDAYQNAAEAHLVADRENPIEIISQGPAEFGLLGAAAVGLAGLEGNRGPFLWQGPSTP